MFGVKTTSGARIITRQSDVVKWAPWGPVRSRIVQQAAYLKLLTPSEVLPTVYSTTRWGYSMERLRMPTQDEFTNLEDNIIIALGEVGAEPRIKERDSAWLMTHFSYIMHRIRKYLPFYEADVSLVMKAVRDLLLLEEPTWIHGDTTFDNVMYRDDQLVLIDPLPPYPNWEMPPFVMSDVGKVLQSLYGYESVKYSGLVPPRNAYVKDFLSTYDYDSAFLALYFCMCHYTRLFPYQPEAKHELFRELFDRVLYDAKEAAIRI